MFMVLAWLFTCALTVKSIVLEKEERIKETLGIMGLGNGVHWAGWFVDTFAVMLISVTSLALVLVVRPTTIDHSDNHTQGNGFLTQD